MADILVHYGVLGMKWGVRRYQNKDGSLTAAGKKRYSTDIEGAKRKVFDAKSKQREAARQYNKATAGGMIYNSKAVKQLEAANLDVRLAKKELSSEKAKEALNAERGAKSSRRIKLEKEYMKKGLTQEEAEIAAYRRAKTEKVLIGIAGVTIAAAAGYAAYKYHKKSIDSVIKEGTLLQNISSDDNRAVRDAFYSSMTKMDNAKYRGIYGRQIKSSGREVFEKKINVDSALKVASEKSATKALSDLVRDDASYAKALEEHLKNSVNRYPSPSQNNLIRRGLQSLKNGKIDEKVYEALNLSLVDHELATSDKVHKGFYEKLKSMGYDAIVDINDKKYSGYKSSNPIITFNSAKTTVQSVRKVGEDEIKKAESKGVLDVAIKSLTPQAAGIAGVYGLISAGSNAITTRSDNEIVRKYREEHPKSNLSYTDIVRMERNKVQKRPKKKRGS